MRALVGDLALSLSWMGLLVVWAVPATVLGLAAPRIGVDTQLVVGAWSVLFFVGFWAVGLWVLFGGWASERFAD